MERYSNQEACSRYIQGRACVKGIPGEGSRVRMHSDTMKHDKVIGLVVSLQITIMSIKNILVVSNPFLLSLNDVLNAYLFFVIGAMYLWGFRYVCRRMKKSSIAILIASAVIICVSALMFNENIPFIRELLPRTILYSFLGFLYISSINNYQYFLDYMTRFSYVIVFASMVSAYMFMQNVGAENLASQYSQALSYYTSIGVMFLLYKYVRDDMKTDLLMVAAGVFVIVVLGSRMHMVNTLSYVALAYVRRIRSEAKSVIRMVLLLTLGFLVVLNVDVMANKLNEILVGQGIYSRTLTLLVSGRIMYPSSRDVIHDVILNEFYERPLVGIGIGGSYLVAGTSSHSMYLEILTTFGLIIGSIVFAFLFYTIARGLQVSRGNMARELIWIYMCLVIPRGFVGGELWDNHDLWRLLGVCISVITNASRARGYQLSSYTSRWHLN